jgi:hypothetical protein
VEVNGRNLLIQSPNDINSGTKFHGNQVDFAKQLIEESRFDLDIGSETILKDLDRMMAENDEIIKSKTGLEI